MEENPKITENTEETVNTPQKNATSSKVEKSKNLEKANAARLMHYKVSRNNGRPHPFKIMTRHPIMGTGDVCCIVGVMEGKEYANGYKTRKSADKSVQELNEQYFSLKTK